MPLNPTTLGNALAGIFSDAANKETEQAAAINDLAQGIALEVINHIKANMIVNSVGSNSGGPVASVSQTIT